MPCPNCNTGIVEPCGPQQTCGQCPECEWHGEMDIPFEEPSQTEFEAAFNSAFGTPTFTPDGSVTPADEVPVDPWDWQSLTLPQGFRWTRYPDSALAGRIELSPTPAYAPDIYPQSIVALREWAAENNVTVSPRSSRAINLGSGYARRPHTFNIRPGDAPTVVPPSEWDEDFECPLCSETHQAYTTTCSDGSYIRCGMCLFFRSDLRDTSTDPQYPSYVCADCRRECDHEGCEVEVMDTQFCDEHRQTDNCRNCDYWIELHIEDSFFLDANGDVLCDECQRRCCPECNRFSNRALTWSEAHDLYLCRRCILGADDAEVFDENDQAELHIPAIPGRENIRLCGVEIEGGDGTGSGRELAAAFHDLGLSEWDRMGSYHSGSEGGFAHVERDSSVDWEAVLGPLNPASDEDVEALTECVKAIRSLVRDGTLTLDLRAGCHIHVEAARTSLDGAYNLNLLFAYAEDVIFRLAAARWPVHRAVQDSHYTLPIPKELRKVQFAQHHNESEDSRYYALSFNNYFNRMLGNCRCGATRYDSWEDCTCSLGKCTFEFRVFNTTANPRKLHAYLALCQALVAKALSLGRAEASDFPALSFVARRFKDMDTTAQEELAESWRERLTWMFTELPLTDDEKANLAYCVRHSELDAVGEEFIETLLPEQQVITEVTA